MLGKKHSPETIEKMKKPKKVKWSQERKEAKRKDELNKIKNGKIMPTTLGITIDIPKVVCPHCNKIGGINGMKRYHFDKCKLRNNS